MSVSLKGKEMAQSLSRQVVRSFHYVIRALGGMRTFRFPELPPGVLIDHHRLLRAFFTQ